MADENQIDFATLRDGACMEQVNEAIAKCVANALYVNTEAEAKRKVVVAITIEPNEQRDVAAVQVTVKSTLAGDKGTLAHITMERDRHGRCHAAEVKAIATKQESLKGLEEVK